MAETEGLWKLTIRFKGDRKTEKYKGLTSEQKNQLIQTAKDAGHYSSHYARRTKLKLGK